MTNATYPQQKPNEAKLLAYGFTKHGTHYQYSTELSDCQMRLTVIISKSGELSTKVIDQTSNEEYLLHRVAHATGPFVCRVRAAYEAILKDITSYCLEAEAFHTAAAKLIISYVRETYGDEPEFLWPKFSRNAVLRRQDNQKWYAVLLAVQADKLGQTGNAEVEILDLRIRPEEIAHTIDNKRFLPGYHMNKQHWYTILLDGSIPAEEICHRIDESYRLACKERKSRL